MEKAGGTAHPSRTKSHLPGHSPEASQVCRRVGPALYPSASLGYTNTIFDSPCHVFPFQIGQSVEQQKTNYRPFNGNFLLQPQRFRRINSQFFNLSQHKSKKYLRIKSSQRRKRRNQDMDFYESWNVLILLVKLLSVLVPYCNDTVGNIDKICKCSKKYMI
jgi:hypothetical protein